MFKLIRQITSDEIAMKALFDHVRNIGIIGVVLGASVWKYHNAGDGYVYYFDMVIVVLLAVFGAFLFIVNQLHGVSKLRKSACPGWVIQVVIQTYSIVVVSVIYSLLWSKT
jgi:hypothetical protein